MTKQTPPKPWKPGQSGNPKGRPKGETRVAKLREAIANELPEIIAGMVEQAKQGDPSAARLLLERALPALKPIELPAPVALGGDSLAAQGRAVLTAAGAGELTPTQAAHLLAALGALAKLAETDDLAARVAALEAKNGKS